MLRDIFPPAIFFRKPESMHLLRLKRLVVRIRDKGKGIDDRSIAVFLNGQAVDCEFDPDWSHVLINDLNYLHKGKNHLLIRVDDRAGNQSVKKIFFSLI